MARVKGRVPVTFSLSPDVLAVVDAHAEVVGLDRYDVLRLAITRGIMVLRVEHEMLKDTSGRYARAMLDAVVGDVGAVETMEVLQAGVAEGLERDVPGGPSKLKRRRKVKDEAA
jgi:hypothetical protein